MYYIYISKTISSSSRLSECILTLCFCIVLFFFGLSLSVRVAAGERLATATTITGLDVFSFIYKRRSVNVCMCLSFSLDLTKYLKPLLVGPLSLIYFYHRSYSAISCNLTVTKVSGDLNGKRSNYSFFFFVRCVVCVIRKSEIFET